MSARDLTATGWARIAALVIPIQDRGGHPCCEDRWREYVNAPLYLVTTGIL